MFSVPALFQPHGSLLHFFTLSAPTSHDRGGYLSALTLVLSPLQLLAYSPSGVATPQRSPTPPLLLRLPGRLLRRRQYSLYVL